MACPVLPILSAGAEGSGSSYLYSYYLSAVREVASFSRVVAIVVAQCISRTLLKPAASHGWSPGSFLRMHVRLHWFKTGYSEAVIFLLKFGTLRSFVFCLGNSVGQVKEFVAND